MRHTVTWLSPHPGETIAYSGHCEQDQHGRPIAAHFNWSPQHLPEAADRWSTHYLVRVAMHELTHALVFSAPLLDHFPGVGGGQPLPARYHPGLAVARYHPSHARDPPSARRHHDRGHPERRRGLGDTHAARAPSRARALRLPETARCASKHVAAGLRRGLQPCASYRLQPYAYRLQPYASRLQPMRPGCKPVCVQVRSSRTAAWRAPRAATGRCDGSEMST